jgi:hypothetical protein
MIKKNIEIISLIYKSTDYLRFICQQMKSENNKVNGWNIGLRIVANDATPAVLEALKQQDIPHTIYNDRLPNDYYLNRVYRCWNFAGYTSNYDNICFINSDMMFSADWLSNLLKYHDGVNIPCSRLVESGKMMSGQHAIGNMNFGRHANAMKEKEWQDYAKLATGAIAKSGGLYMPCVLEKSRFIESGGYPEGNIYRDGIGTLTGHPIKSGDDYYFHDILSKKFGMIHLTVFNSLVYHIQEGEKDE